MIRKATAVDVPAVTGLYEAVHTAEEAGITTTGWIRGVYPTRSTVELALAQDDLYVMEEDGVILAAARLNREQVDVYRDVPWLYEAGEDEVFVLHTLAVHPAFFGRGCGSRFVAFYEDLAREMNCPVLRMDTNERNTNARRLYKKLGYREAGIVPCVFNGIPGVGLVCLEKRL